jgi:hypothetical protein
VAGRVPGWHAEQVIEPLPSWAKAFLALFGLGVIAALAFYVVEGRLGDPEPAAWHVDPDAALGPESREVPVIVNEAACASGRSAEGRISADVADVPNAVRIEIGVRPLGGDQDCLGNPDTPYVVELDEPLGERMIAGERWPEP